MLKGGKFQTESGDSEKILKETGGQRERSGLKRKQTRREDNNPLKVKAIGT